MSPIPGTLNFSPNTMGATGSPPNFQNFSPHTAIPTFSGDIPPDQVLFGNGNANPGPGQPQPTFGVAIMSAIAACCGCCLLVMLGAGIGVGSAVGRLIPKGGA